ncbi:hypothetical protein BGX29_001721 [Mortierella sp. GBA35]|nr:hypothetical protein BGX29_001721 [Mortierella sp. GBA35]KAG0216913.1 hypothetical protein BGX33_011831 [Mortierella sp. NVP41]
MSTEGQQNIGLPKENLLRDEGLADQSQGPQDSKGPLGGGIKKLQREMEDVNQQLLQLDIGNGNAPPDQVLDNLGDKIRGLESGVAQAYKDVKKAEEM